MSECAFVCACVCVRARVSSHCAFFFFGFNVGPYHAHAVRFHGVAHAIVVVCALYAVLAPPQPYACTWATTTQLPISGAPHANVSISRKICIHAPES